MCKKNFHKKNMSLKTLLELRLSLKDIVLQDLLKRWIFFKTILQDSCKILQDNFPWSTRVNFVGLKMHQHGDDF